MKEVPEGFARRQGAGAGLISKYTGLYLRSYFKSVEHPERRQIYSIKGTTTAEFRKMWGIQEAYEKKSRDNHTHHCIDAIVIACIGKREYDATAQYYHQHEEYRFGYGTRPNFPKPWPTFTEDVKRISEEIAVVHNTSDNMPKKASRRMDVTGKGRVVAKGDCARSSLHKDTYYGAIKRDGEIRYVVRRELSSFKKTSDIDNIVDDVVREKVRSAVEGRDFKKAIAKPIYMNKEKGILIKKVRCYAGKPTLDIRHHRDQSTKPYKQQYHVEIDENYCMAIYDGVLKGRVKRSYLLVNMLNAASHFKKNEEIVPLSNDTDLPLKYVVKKGTNVLLYEVSPREVHEADNKELARRLYKVVGMNNEGRIYLRHTTEARQSKEIKYKDGAYMQQEALRAGIRMYHNQFNALVDGYDFDITPIGEIKFR